MAALLFQDYMSRQTIIATAALLLAAAGPLHANDGTPPSRVEINGVRDPVLQPYRIMSAGFAAMEKHRALAPDARDLQFRLGPRSTAPADVMAGLTLRLDGAGTDMPLPINAAGVFTLPRSETAASDNAKLVLNRKQAYIRWMPYVRSAGVAPGFVRLGDTRMECQVLVGVVKKMANFAIEMAMNGFMGRDWCANEKFQIPTFTVQRIAAATLIHGAERVPLRIEEHGAGFYSPVSNPRYGNDDLIEVTYATAEPEA